MSGFFLAFKACHNFIEPKLSSSNDLTEIGEITFQSQNQHYKVQWAIGAKGKTFDHTINGDSLVALLIKYGGVALW